MDRITSVGNYHSGSYSARVRDDNELIHDDKKEPKVKIMMVGIVAVEAIIQGIMEDGHGRSRPDGSETDPNQLKR